MSDTFNATDSQENQDQANDQQTFSTGVEQQPEQAQQSSGQVDPNEIEKIKKRLDDKDNFIEQLKNERRQDEQKIASLEEQLNQVKSTEEILEELENRQTSDSSQSTQNSGSDNSSNSGQQLSAEEIARQAEERVLQNLSQKEQEKKEQQNFSQIQEQLSEMYGNKADEIVSQTAKENDLSWEDAVQMARRSPKAFMKLFGTDQKSSQASQPTRGTEKPQFNQQQDDRPKKSVMHNSKTNDVVEAFRKAKPEIE